MFGSRVLSGDMCFLHSFDTAMQDSRSDGATGNARESPKVYLGRCINANVELLIERWNAIHVAF